MSKHQRPSWRTIGFWLALALALSQLANAIRVSFGAMDYSVYMGLPLQNADDVSWVFVYALRALFLGSFAGYLLWRQHYAVLRAMALFAIVMPIGDFYLVWAAQGSTGTLARHALIAAVLLAAWFSLGALVHRQNQSEHS